MKGKKDLNEASKVLTACCWLYANYVTGKSGAAGARSFEDLGNREGPVQIEENDYAEVMGEVGNAE